MNKFNVAIICFTVCFTLCFITLIAVSTVDNVDPIVSCDTTTQYTDNDYKNTLPIAPSDIVNDQDIYVYKDRIVIYLNNATWSHFTDTNSMIPTFDYGHNSVQIMPKNESDVNVGDIITYTNTNDDNIIHRVMETGTDSDGWYCIVQGDNNKYEDYNKVRFDMVRGRTVVVIY